MRAPASGQEQVLPGHLTGPRHDVWDVLARWGNRAWSANLERSFYWASMIGLSALVVMPMWVLGYLPLGDLPDHAGMIQAIIDFAPYKAEFSVNWFTPYLLGYAVTLLFAQFMPVAIAIKLALSVFVLATPLAVVYLVRVLGGNKYWAWAAFPIAHSFAFYWGFLSYVTATPLAILFCAFAVRYGTATLDRKWFALAAVFSAGLFMSHAMAWGFAISTATLILLQQNSFRAAMRKASAFVLILPLVAYWMASSSGANREVVEIGNYLEHYVGKAATEMQYVVSEFNNRTALGEHGQRARELFSFAIGQAPMWDFVAMGALILSWPLWIGARLSRDWRCWLPLANTVALFMLVPYWIFDTAYVYQRFAVFLIPMSMFIYRPTAENANGADQPTSRVTLVHATALAIVAIVVFSTTATFAKFKDDEAHFRGVLDYMQPGKRVMSVIFDGDSPFRYSPPYMHYANWYQAEKGGEVVPNFARDPHARNVPLRYNGRPVQMPSLWAPHEFNWYAHEGRLYDYFLIRARTDSSAYFPGARLVMQSGHWRLYERIESP